AYFLSTDVRGQPAYPYLLGATYYGEMKLSARDGVAHAPLERRDWRRIELSAPATIDAGQMARLTLSIRDAGGREIRYLERVHERPIHLAIVSADFSEFAHVHPQ